MGKHLVNSPDSKEELENSQVKVQWEQQQLSAKKKSLEAETDEGKEMLVKAKLKKLRGEAQALSEQVMLLPTRIILVSCLCSIRTV